MSQQFGRETGELLTALRWCGSDGDRQTDFLLKWQPSDTAGPCKRETSKGMNPTNHKSTAERAASRCPGDPPTTGSDFWRENKEHVAEADRHRRYTSGQQEPESLIMSQLLGWMLPSAEITLAG